MSISYVGAGTAATPTNGEISVPYPAGIAAGNLLVLAIAHKRDTNIVNTPSGFTAAASASGGLGGPSTTDEGSMVATWLVREADGSESGSVAVTFNPTNTGYSAGIMLAYSRSSAAWDTAGAGGGDNVADASWSVTAGSDPGLAAGDVVVTNSAINTDSYVFSSPNLTASGATIGSHTSRHDLGSSVGFDGRQIVYEHNVTAGASSGAPSFSLASSGSSSSRPTGATAFLRIRDTAGGSAFTPAWARGSNVVIQ